jgi:serine/threonine protein phosphatase 1
MRHRIGKNENGGRDFVIGDLHGAIERLYQFMAFINFDKTKDRIFSVGDLVDRGPNSLECLMLIYEPWFFAVRGNHEQLMADFFFNGPTGMWWAPNGGSWGIQYAYPHNPDDEAAVVRDAVKKANELPLMLTVKKQDGGFFHVIHAELSSPVELSDEDLDNEETLNYVARAPSADGESIIWGRYIFLPLYGAKYDKDRHSKYFEGSDAGTMFGPKLSHIYSGHTIMRHPTRFKGQTNLDTGAYRSIREVANGKSREPDDWAALTVTEPLTDKFWKVNELGVHEIEPIVI